MVHAANLTEYESVLHEALTAASMIRDADRCQMIKFHLQQVTVQIRNLKGNTLRKRRAIEWLGSAWKWLAGSPDATDWSSIVDNNNQQHYVNQKMFNLTGTIANRMNQIVQRMVNESDEVGDERLSSSLLNKVLVLKDEVHELTRACQMAKAGIINTNLLDSGELKRAISEVATLPYANDIEALEYSMPSVYTNGSILLYVISIPKIRDEIYNVLIVRPSIQSSKRIYLPYKKLLVNEDETYGIMNDCANFSNLTVCRQEDLVELEKGECIPKLLRGGQAGCVYETKTESEVELLEPSMLFVTNFNGSLMWAKGKEYLTGTYVIQLNNETVTLGNRTYSSVTLTTHLEALPAVLSNITSVNHKINLEYVHQLNLQNIKTLLHLKKNFHISLSTGIAIISLLIVATIIMGRKIFSRTILPPIRSTTDAEDPHFNCVSVINLRDADA